MHADHRAELRTLDPATGRVRSVHDLGADGILSADFTSDGTGLAWSTLTRKVMTRDPDGSIRERGQHGGPVQSVVLLDDGESLYSAGEDGEVRLWSLSSGAQRVVIRHPEAILSVAVLDEGRTIVAGTADGSLIHVQDRVPHSSDELREWVAKATDYRVEPGLGGGGDILAR